MLLEEHHVLFYQTDNPKDVKISWEGKHNVSGSLSFSGNGISISDNLWPCHML